MKPFSAPLLENSLKGTPLMATTLLGCSAGFLLFGYDQGIANALTQSPDFQTRFPSIYGPENATLLGATLAFFVLGAFFGCLANIWIGNKFGRRTVLIAGGVGTLIGGALQAGSINLAMLMASRLINGFAVGQLTATVPPYVAELTKPRFRGTLMSIELVLAATGLMSAFWVTYAFRKETGELGWRIPLAIQAMLVLISLVCLLFSPESPRYLVEVGQPEEGRKILARIHGQAYADEAMIEIQEAVALERAVASDTTWATIFENNKQCFRYRTLLCMGVNFFQQATGVNIATYYAGSIFIDGIGLVPDTALLVLGNLGVVGLIFTIAGCFYFVDNFGRVRTMILGSVLNCFAMILLAAGLTQTRADGSLEGPASYAGAVGLFLFIASFSGFWLVPSWIYGAEISPLKIRSKANSLGISMQYLFNFAVVMVTPVGIARIGGYYYIPYAVSNAIIAVLLFLYFPEPARLSLEQIDSLFADGKVWVRRSPRQGLEKGPLSATGSYTPPTDKIEDDQRSLA